MSAHNDTVGMILAAGEGTRMRPLTHHCPKPLLPFHGTPIIERIARSLAPLNLSSVGVNAHHLADVLLPWLRTHYPNFVRNHEEPLLGSGGGVRAMHALLPPSTHFLYHNGDIFTDAPLDELLQRHRASDADVTMLLTTSDAAEGNVGFDSSTARVVALPTHTAMAQTQARFERTSFGGIMVFKRRIIDRLPSDDTTPCIIRDAITPLLLDGGNIQGLFHPGIVSDLGTHDRWISALHTVSSPPFEDEHLALLPQAITLKSDKDSVRFVP